MRQGDTIGSLLFNIVLEIGVRRCKVEIRGTIFDRFSQIVAYFDVLFIMGRRFLDVEEVVTSLVEQTNKMGLEINEKKTNCMLV